MIKRHTHNLLKRIGNIFFGHRWHIWKERPDLDLGRECVVCHRVEYWDHETFLRLYAVE
jgi:hypothetical protein